MCRHDSDAQQHDKKAKRFVITGHPWARVGPDLYDGRNDDAATITIDSSAWQVIATSGNVTHTRETRTFEEIRNEAIKCDAILANPSLYKNKAVVIEGYWISHVEGEWLASKAGPPLQYGLSLGGTLTSWFIEADGTEVPDQWSLGATRRVVVSGTLRIGEWDGGMIALTNHPYLEVDVVVALDKPSDVSSPPDESKMEIPGEGVSKTFRKQMGDYTYVHLAWFYDQDISSQLMLKLEEDEIRAVSETELGVISIWVLESREADGLRVLQSNPNWMAAIVKGNNGFRPESKSQGGDKPQPEQEGLPR